MIAWMHNSYQIIGWYSRKKWRIIKYLHHLTVFDSIWQILAVIIFHERQQVHENPSQKCLLAQYLCWCLASNPQHTTVCLRFATHKEDFIRREVPHSGEIRPRRDLEPKSYFWDGFDWHIFAKKRSSINIKKPDCLALTIIGNPALSLLVNQIISRIAYKNRFLWPDWLFF